MGKDAVRRIRGDHYRVDFARLANGRRSALFELFAPPRQVDLDPFLVARALRAVMERSTTKNVHGQPLLWNEYRIFLSSCDHEALRPLAARLKAGLDTMIRQVLQELGAETVGDPVVRLLIDEERETPEGFADVLTGWVENQDLAPSGDREVTIRVACHGALARPAEVTQAVGEPAGKGSLLLCWDDERAHIPPGGRVTVGRLHTNPPSDFVPLVQASQKINGRQLVIENDPAGVVISRLAKANPVQVGGRVIQAGGKLQVAELPVEIFLSNGEMVLHLDRWGDG